MHLTKAALAEMPRLKKINIINSVSGIKPANLIGTISKTNRSNLAIFSSVVHMGSSPPIMGMVSRPDEEVPRHTYQNILDTGFYTINHVHQSFVENAHYTAAKFDDVTSEFDACQLTEEYIGDFKAPFVKESVIKLGMKYLESIPIKINGTILILGELQELFFPDEIMDERGHLDLAKASDIGISGLNSYYALEKIGQFPYARPHELPDFEKA